MTRLRTANVRRARKQLWVWWRPRFDAGDFGAFLMSLNWRDKKSRYFLTPKASTDTGGGDG